MSTLDPLWYSLSNLYEDFGSTSNYLVGLAVNLATILVGVLAFVGLPEPFHYAGIPIAIWGLWAIVAWVIGL